MLQLYYSPLLFGAKPREALALCRHHPRISLASVGGQDVRVEGLEEDGQASPGSLVPLHRPPY